MTNETLIQEAKKLAPISNRQAVFLINWYVDQKDKEFGFREVRGFHEQLKMAIDFYKETEQEWQDRILNNQTSLSFPEFFVDKAKSNMVDLPEKLVKKMEAIDEV